MNRARDCPGEFSLQMKLIFTAFDRSHDYQKLARVEMHADIFRAYYDVIRTKNSIPTTFWTEKCNQGEV